MDGSIKVEAPNDVATLGKDVPKTGVFPDDIVALAKKVIPAHLANNICDRRRFVV